MTAGHGHTLSHLGIPLRLLLTGQARGLWSSSKWSWPTERACLMHLMV